MRVEIEPVKSNYLHHPKFESHTFQHMNGFLYWRSQGLIQAIFDIGMPMYSLFGHLNNNAESSSCSNLVSKDANLDTFLTIDV